LAASVSSSNVWMRAMVPCKYDTWYVLTCRCECAQLCANTNAKDVYA
jgi:hypothetical protein